MFPLEEDRNLVNQEPNQEPGSVLFLKRKALILGQTKNLLVEPGTSSYLPGTYWLNTGIKAGNYCSPLQITNNKEGQKSQNQEPEPEPLVSRLLGRPASYHNHFIKFIL